MAGTSSHDLNSHGSIAALHTMHSQHSVSVNSLLATATTGSAAAASHVSFESAASSDNGRLITRHQKAHGSAARVKDASTPHGGFCVDLTFRLKDHYTALVNAPWKYVVLFFTGMYASLYLFFAIFWYIIAVSDGTCLTGGPSFTSAWLLSVELQATIGYGNTYPNGDCVGGTILMFFQVIVGLLNEVFAVGIVVAKFRHPTKRRYTIAFSRRACVTYFNDELALIFRVGDLRPNTPFANPKVKLVMFYEHVTLEGEVIPFQQIVLPIGNGYGATMDDCLFAAPTQIVYCVTENSILFGKLNREALEAMHAEFVLIFEGNIQETGMTLHTRTSYKARDVLFGARFVPTTMRSESGEAMVKWNMFDATEDCPVYHLRRLHDEAAHALHIPITRGPKPQRASMRLGADHDDADDAESSPPTSRVRSRGNLVLGSSGVDDHPALSILSQHLLVADDTSEPAAVKATALPAHYSVLKKPIFEEEEESDDNLETDFTSAAGIIAIRHESETEVQKRVPATAPGDQVLLPAPGSDTENHATEMAAADSIC